MKSTKLKSYSRNYLLTHSLCASLDTAKLYEEAASSNPRLYYPLFVYCVEFKKVRCLNLFSTELEEMSKYESFEEYLANTEEYELMKYYNSFLSHNRRCNQDSQKDSFRNMFLNRKNKSDYYYYKNAGLNNGNYHRFMYQNDNKALSLQNCYKLLDMLDVESV